MFDALFRELRKLTIYEDHNEFVISSSIWIFQNVINSNFPSMCDLKEKMVPSLRSEVDNLNTRLKARIIFYFKYFIYFVYLRAVVKINILHTLRLCSFVMSMTILKSLTGFLIMSNCWNNKLWFSACTNKYSTNAKAANIGPFIIAIFSKNFTHLFPRRTLINHMSDRMCSFKFGLLVI